MKTPHFKIGFKGLVSILTIALLVACGGQNQQSESENSAALEGSNSSETSNLQAENLDPELRSANAGLIGSNLSEATISLNIEQDKNTTAQLSPEEVKALPTLEVTATANAKLNPSAIAPTPANPALLTAANEAQLESDQIVIKYKNSATAVNAKIAQAQAQSQANNSELSNGSSMGSARLNAATLSKGLSQIAVKNKVQLQFQSNTHDNAAVFNLGKKLKPAELTQLTQQIKASDPNIEYVAVDGHVFPTATPNDSFFSMQWNYKTAEPYGLNAQSAWDKADGAGVVVAVVDSGYRPHADLVGKILPGYDFIKSTLVSNDGNGRDKNAIDPGDAYTNFLCGFNFPSSQTNSWHGLQMAGIIAANKNNSMFISGIASGVKILPVRVMGRCGGSISDVADGIVWASGGAVPGVPKNKTPAKIINVSLATLTNFGCNPMYAEAIKKARANGAIVVVSGGNFGDMSYSTPANCSNVISVAASLKNGDPFFKVSGASLYAPGQNILTLSNTGDYTVGTDNELVYSNGSSIATAQVSGLMALILSYRPRMPAAELVELIKALKKPLLNCNCNNNGVPKVDEIMKRANATNYRAKDDFKGSVSGYGKSGITLEQTVLGQRKLTMGFIEKNKIQLPFVQENISATSSIQSGDFDGDGKSDVLLSAGGLLENFYQLQSNLVGGLGSEFPLNGGGHKRPDFIDDFDQDGKDDFAFYDPVTQTLKIAYVDAMGNWTDASFNYEDLEPIISQRSLVGGMVVEVNEAPFVYRRQGTQVYGYLTPLDPQYFELKPNEQIIGSGKFLKNDFAQMLVLNTASRQLYAVGLEKNFDSFVYQGAYFLNYKPLFKLPSSSNLVNIGDYNGNGQDDFLIRNSTSKAISLVSFTNNSFKLSALAKLPAGYEFGYSSAVRKF